VKYRGSAHGTNEYPFIIDEAGFEVLPITSMGLAHAAMEERISSGVERLDAMLGGKGFYRGSSILVSGTAGTGKSSLAAHFAAATCRRSERCLYFAFEESPSQILRNMHSIGLDLEPLVKQGFLKFHAVRPTVSGLEGHLTTIYKLLREFQPSVMIMDPISNLFSVGSALDVRATLMRLIDHLKSLQVTAFFTSLNHGGSHLEATDVGISSLIDTWLLLRDIELYGERNRGLYVLKSRGMGHSNQIREFLLTRRGIDLLDVYTGPDGVLTGSARLAQEARERAVEDEQQRELEQRRRQFERKRHALAAQIAVLQAELQAEEDVVQNLARQERERQQSRQAVEAAMARSRKADANEIDHEGNGQQGTVRQGTGL
jgi:circadian clock protein KaiC